MKLDIALLKALQFHLVAEHNHLSSMFIVDDYDAGRRDEIEDILGRLNEALGTAPAVEPTVVDHLDRDYRKAIQELRADYAAGLARAREILAE